MFAGLFREVAQVPQFGNIAIKARNATKSGPDHGTYDSSSELPRRNVGRRMKTRIANKGGQLIADTEVKPHSPAVQHRPRSLR
jgi:hypothetical protein